MIKKLTYKIDVWSKCQDFERVSIDNQCLYVCQICKYNRLNYHNLSAYAREFCKNNKKHLVAYQQGVLFVLI